MSYSTKETVYYLKAPINTSGIAETQNPSRLSDYDIMNVGPIKRNIGQYFNSDSKYDERLGDVVKAIESGLTIDDLRAEQRSIERENLVSSAIELASGITFIGLIGLLLFKCLTKNNKYFE